MYISIVKSSKIKDLLAKIDQLIFENSELKLSNFSLNEQNKHLEIENNRLKLENAELTETSRTGSQQTLNTWTSGPSERNYGDNKRKIKERKNMSTFSRPEIKKKVPPKVPVRICSLPKAEYEKLAFEDKQKSVFQGSIGIINPHSKLSISEVSVRSLEQRDQNQIDIEDDKENFQNSCTYNNSNSNNNNNNNNNNSNDNDNDHNLNQNHPVKFS